MSLRIFFCLRQNLLRRRSSPPVGGKILAFEPIGSRANTGQRKKITPSEWMVLFFLAYPTLFAASRGKCNAKSPSVAFFMLHYSANLVCIIPITVLSFRKIQLDNFPFLRQYIQQPNNRRYFMTKQQASPEMKYRLSIYVLQVLLDRGDHG